MNRIQQRVKFKELLLPPYKSDTHAFTYGVLNYAGNVVFEEMTKRHLSEEEVRGSVIEEERFKQIIEGGTAPWSVDELERISNKLLEDIGELLPIDYRELSKRGKEVYKEACGENLPEQLSVSIIPAYMAELFLVSDLNK